MTGKARGLRSGDKLTVTRGGQRFEVDADEVGGTPNSAVHGRAHFDSTTSIAIVTVNVPAPIVDTVAVQGETVNCTVDTALATITYEGNTPRLCNISAVVNTAAQAGTPARTINIEVDGVVVATSDGGGGGDILKEVEITQTLQPGSVVRLSATNTFDNSDLEVSPFRGMRGSVGTFEPTHGYFVVTGI